jgi:hypothetical protein
MDFSYTQRDKRDSVHLMLAEITAVSPENRGEKSAPQVRFYVNRSMAA